MLENVKENVSKLYIPIYKEEFIFSTQTPEDAIKDYDFIDEQYFLTCDAISSFESEGKQNFIWISPQIYSESITDKIIVVTETALNVSSKILEQGNVNYFSDNINVLKYLQTYIIEILLPVFGIGDFREDLENNIDDIDIFGDGNSI